jgi:26S proteasome regulatory subunit N8
MLVVYLSSLLRAVIALHALVDNKTTIGKAELDESEKEKTKKEEKEKEKEKEKSETKDSEESNADSKRASQ